jgi:hypothetical protein
MNVQVAAYTVPTEAPESDGTAEWDRTTLVLIELAHEDLRGLGYTYADPATARAARFLAPHVAACSPYNVRSIFETCVTIGATTAAAAPPPWPSRRSTARPGT